MFFIAKTLPFVNLGLDELHVLFVRYGHDFLLILDHSM